MNVNEMLATYLKKHYEDQEKIIKFTKENTLYFSTAYLFDIDIEKQVTYRINKLRYDFFVKKFLEIQNLFSLSNIKMILFKGIVLANRLYDQPQKRCFGDIDIFVDKEDFPAALVLLIRLGYDFIDNKTFYDNMHIALVKEGVVVELHKKITFPNLEINDRYLLEHTESFSISGNAIQTLDITASFLHMFYHLYEDTYLKCAGLNSVLETGKVPKIRRFIYRAYEIALYSEKYYNQIKWDDFVNDLKRQKLRIFFKKMIRDIVKIFPDVFPDRCMEIINNIEYIDDEHDVWCKRILDYDCFEEDIGHILSEYIDEYWERHATQNMHIKVGEGFTLNNPYIKNEENDDNYKFICTVSTKKANGDLKLTFKVSDNDFSFTGPDNFDTTTSDGVHLMLFGTEKYSYNSIYIFPKIINGEAMAIPVDVKRGERTVIDPSLISTNCECTDRDYTITVTLTNKFLQENNLSKYLYMGLIIINCSPKTRKRKAELVLADTYSEWYNPTCFAKVDINLDR